jgi:hypothetical protein
MEGDHAYVTRTIVWVATLWFGLVGLNVLVQRLAHAHVTTCVFRHLTGLPCPTCGGTRATIALATGHPLHALALNPMVAVGSIVLGAVLIALFAGRRDMVHRLISSRRAAIVLLAIILLNWAYLLWHGVPPA